MSNNAQETHGEKRILGHEPVDGYRPAFYICLALGVVYLIVILAKTL
jgi:hypothetical protein